MTIDRRQFLQSGAAAALLAALARDGQADTAPDDGRLGFQSVPATLRDAVTVPPGYRAQVLYPWGAPTGIAGAMPAFAPDASNSAADQALQAGMHHDGMHFFALDGRSDRGLLVMNHEYTDERLLHADGASPWTADKVHKSLHAMGVSVIEVELAASGWRQVLPSRHARRIHGRTPMRIAGPAAGHARLRTAADPEGTRVAGTLANCAMGVTPWGTYLTCEENFQAYFGGDKETLAKVDPAQRRYGLGPGSWSDYWQADERFDLGRNPNESNRFGWVVEIDPFDPDSTPVKRTALGRKHQESATCALTKDGRLAVYMGDDSAFEYIFKFVSRDKPRPGSDAQARIANRDLLDHGRLYVARYEADGRGRWLELRHGQGGIDRAGGFADAAEVLIHARLAGDIAGGTRMDRPEWIAIHPDTGEAYVALTGNTLRGAPGMPAPDAANPRAGNLFGGILRWREDGRDAGSLGFSWDHFALAGDPAVEGAGVRYPDAGADAFGNPDGLVFDSGGLLWIQTDMSGRAIGRGPMAALGNNQMLCADPATGRIKRFLVGPAGCEVTGCVLTPDRRSLFVNIQHPGETREGGSGTPNSAWPDGGTPGSARPRSATVVVRREDGGIVGT